MKSSRRLARDGVRGDPRRYLHRVSPLGRSASICARRIAEPLVQIGAHFRNQRLDSVFEEVVGAAPLACFVIRWRRAHGASP